MLAGFSYHVTEVLCHNGISSRGARAGQVSCVSSSFAVIDVSAFVNDDGQ